MKAEFSVAIVERYLRNFLTPGPEPKVTYRLLIRTCTLKYRKTGRLLDCVAYLRPLVRRGRLNLSLGFFLAQKSKLRVAIRGVYPSISVNDIADKLIN